MAQHRIDRYHRAPMVDSCEHIDLNFDINVTRFNDTGMRRVMLSGVCMGCGRRVQFAGLPYDRPVENAVTTASAREAHIPFVMV